jgi:hypothetical protein
MPVTFFEGFIEEVEQHKVYVRLIDVKNPCETLTGEISIKRFSNRDRKYIFEGVAFNFVVRNNDPHKEDRTVLRIKKSNKVYDNISDLVEKLSRLLGLS